MHDSAQKNRNNSLISVAYTDFAVLVVLVVLMVLVVLVVLMSEGWVQGRERGAF